MKRTMLVQCAIFLYLIIFSDAKLYHNYDLKPHSKNHKHFLSQVDSIPWSKNRQKRTLNENDLIRYQDFDPQKITPWAILTLNERSPRTPERVNRNSNNEIGFGREDRWVQDIDFVSRSPPFAPRLGRSMSPYISRLKGDAEKIILY